MKIEWVFDHDLYADDPRSDDDNCPVTVPVVRLPEADALLKDAVWAMEHIALVELGTCEEVQVARQFLASPLVQAWRERQKEVTR